MKKFLCLYLFFLALSPAKAINEIDSLLTQLEITMAQRDQFDQKKENRIAQLKELLLKNDNHLEQIFFINKQLIDEYLTYTLDSALHFINKNLLLSQQINNIELVHQNNILLAYIMASSGRSFEAFDILNCIDKRELSNTLLIEYYKTFIKTYNELSFYAPLPSNYHKYYSKVEAYTDSLIPYLDKDTDDYLSILEKKYRDDRNLLECKKINTRRLSKTKMGKRLYSQITFERSLLYQLEEDDEMQMKYLILSATSDIQSSVKDNASLT